MWQSQINVAKITVFQKVCQFFGNIFNAKKFAIFERPIQL